jgi:hypothetical protein
MQAASFRLRRAQAKEAESARLAAELAR